MFDSHVHYDHKRFDCGREELLEQMHENGLEYCLNAAIGFASNESMIKLLGKYAWVFFAVGIHPNAVEISDENDQKYLEQLHKLAELEPVKAIGETGLDYYRFQQIADADLGTTIEELKERQKKWFCLSLELAKAHQLPLVLHVRGDAHQDALEILDKYGYEGMTGVLHCFSEDYDTAKEYLKRGFFLGIGGMITRAEMEGVRETVKNVPLEKLLLETDSPFVRPEGMTGKRNTSESLHIIAEKMGEIKGVSKEKIIDATRENAMRLFLHI